MSFCGGRSGAMASFVSIHHCIVNSPGCPDAAGSSDLPLCSARRRECPEYGGYSIVGTSFWKSHGTTTRTRSEVLTPALCTARGCQKHTSDGQPVRERLVRMIDGEATSNRKIQGNTRTSRLPSDLHGDDVRFNRSQEVGISIKWLHVDLSLHVVIALPMGARPQSEAPCINNGSRDQNRESVRSPLHI